MLKKYILQIVVLLSILVTILINSLANILPINGYTTGELSDDIPIFFVPAGYVFAIWGLIYVSQIFYAIYTFFNYSETDKKIFPYILITCVANCSWILLWHYKHVSLSVLAMIVLLLSLILIYQKVSKNGYPLIKSFMFRLYLGWVSVASIANIAAALSLTTWDRFGIREEMWSAGMIGVATILALLTLNIKKDYIYPLVIIWAVVGILVKFFNTSDLVAGASVVSIIVILGSIFTKIYTSKYRKEE
jgi:hypothetical protein